MLQAERFLHILLEQSRDTMFKFCLARYHMQDCALYRLSCTLVQLHFTK